MFRIKKGSNRLAVGRSNRLKLEIALGLLTSILSFSLFLNLTQTVMEKGKFVFDPVFWNFAYKIRSPFLTPLMFFLSFAGVNLTLFVGILILTFLLYKKRGKEAGLFSLLMLGGGVLAFFLKDLTGRLRPNIAPLTMEHSLSFPSGHSMNSIIFYSLLTYFVFHFTRNKKLAVLTGFVSFIVVLLIGFSRIYLGVHYASDVFGGFLAGISWVSGVLTVTKIRLLQTRTRS